VTIEVAGEPRLARIPADFDLEFLAAAATPRLLTFAPNGDLFAGSRSGRIHRFAPPYTSAATFAALDRYPHSVAFRDGEILIARTDGLYSAPFEPGQDSLDPADVTLVAALPGATAGHTSRTVRIGPDGRVYVALGITGNCSDEYLGEPYEFERRRGGIVRLVETLEESGWEVFASGLRNPVGFAWRAGGEMYASNNGPDHLGFNEPREYFSRIEEGSFHGMPWYQLVAGSIVRDSCQSSTPPLPAGQVVGPAVTFDARNAPMAVEFVAAGDLGGRFEGDAIVALRGSWGTAPDGTGSGDPATRRHPKLVLVRFLDGRPVRVDDLITGFQLPDGSRWARPVGVAIGPDGSLYFSADEGAGQGLYRLRPRF
jgi:glucose/arabinose dehydrogenase